MSIVDLPTIAASLDKLLKYYAQLLVLSIKFPSDIGIDLTWYNTLGYSNSAASTYSTVEFEQINVLYNIAALYSSLAFNQPEDPDSIKLSYNYFQLSAGVFRYLLEIAVPMSQNPLPFGLDIDTLETLKQFMLAQGHECFWQRAVAGGMKNSIVAKLAYQVSQLYMSALIHANRSSTIRSEWVQFMICKRYHFEAAAHYRASVNALEKAKYGDEVAHLTASVAACNKGLKESKYVSASVLDDLRGLLAKAKSDLVRAEKDNDLIYLHIVPSAAELAPLSKTTDVMTKPILPPQLEAGAASVDKPLFVDLLPYAVYQASKVYAEQLDTFLYRNVVSEISSLQTKLHEELGKLNLPGSLDAVEKPLGIPQQLLDHSEHIKANGGVAGLRESINELYQLSEEKRKMLNDGKECLDIEEREDNMMREKEGTQRWVRVPSREAARDLWKRYETIRHYLDTAAQSDESVRSKFASVEHLLQVLEVGRPALQEYIPDTSVQQLDRNVQKIISELREELSNTKTLELYWQKHINHLRTQVSNVDLFPEMEKYYRQLRQEDAYRKIDASVFEPVFKKYVTRFDGDIRWVELQKRDLESALEAVRVKNRAFANLGNLGEGSFQRQQQIQSLELAFSRFVEMQSNQVEGVKFYNSIADQMKQFVDNCDEFIFSRRMQGRELETSIRQQSGLLPDQSQTPSTPSLLSPTPSRPSHEWDYTTGSRFN
ncbi:pH-response regulator protein palA/Rim20p [Trichomonascus vanleenenianus]|uniref:Rim20p n=1 Tax=Trichomonascus vanleenenianus TaxID=2268995 RepID=UPI003EC9B874